MGEEESFFALDSLIAESINDTQDSAPSFTQSDLSAERHYVKVNKKAHRQKLKSNEQSNDPSSEINHAYPRRPKPVQLNQKPGLCEPGVNAIYQTTNRIRHVAPYPFVHYVHAKKRWYGRLLVDVMNNEFKHKQPDYYHIAITQGRILINKNVVTTDAVIQRGDLVSHEMHRHEPPVMDWYQSNEQSSNQSDSKSSNQPMSQTPFSSIPIVHQDDQLIVINKPGSIAIHPCGKYWHNTIIAIMRHEGRGELFPVHRLDRWTSGVLLLARDGKSAAKFAQQIQNQQMTKVYLARVVGEFPETLTVDAPCGFLSRALGRHGVTPTGKQATTTFRRVSFNGHTSVVECKPLTGRTHQIRIHLHHAGYPIMNDPLHGGHMIEENHYCFNQSPVWTENHHDPHCAQCEKSQSIYHFCFNA